MTGLLKARIKITKHGLTRLQTSKIKTIGIHRLICNTLYSFNHFKEFK